jgi:protocatechuate 3,4-dioxygenase beta subunit
VSQQAVTPADITDRVIESFDACPDPRLREVLQSLVRHLHGFAQEVRLTQAEWERAMAILTRTGDITTDERQEFILWSDTLGLSMLVDAMANPTPPGATESTVLGPFHVEGSTPRAYGESISERSGGSPTWFSGHVRSLDGTPLAGATLDVWQNDETLNLYPVQDPDAPEQHLRGLFQTRDDGSYAFLAMRPTDYTIPEDGPVGDMIAATGRHAWRPAHLHVIAGAPGHRSVVTHFFDARSPHLDSDVVFAVKPSLVRPFVHHPAGDPDTPPGVDGEWWSCETDIVLAPES